MSTSGSPAETPEFALAAETDTSGANTIVTVSSHSVLTDRRSDRAGSSLPQSWNVVSQGGQTGVTPTNLSQMEISDRSRPIKRSDQRNSRSPRHTKSPRRNSEARGSNIPMTADERLEQLVRQSRPGNARRDEGPSLGNLAIGSRTPYPMSPSMATAMASPPRELTRIMPISPQDIPITDITSDENGRDVVEGVQNPNNRMLMLNDEVVNMTQRQLTSEFELAEFSNIVSEAEVREYNLQRELSQEIHMFNEARNLIIEMRANFSIEDQGCITRIEMLETQRNEFATGLIEVGNRAEMVLQERHAEHQSELRAVKIRAEEFIGQQNQNIAILRNELTQANEHLQSGNYRNERSIYHEREVERINGLLSDELLVAKVNSQQQENEISLMQKVVSDRTTLLNSEIMGLRSTVQNQNAQIANRSGFTDEEIRNYLTRKLAMIEDEYRQEARTQQAMIQSEGDVARMYKGRFEHITQSSLGKDPDTDQLIKSLKSRLDQEATYTKNYMHQNDKMSDEVSDMARKLNSEEYRAKQNSRVLDRTQAQLEQEEQIRSRLDQINRDSKDEMNQKDERIAYLSSENDRLRDDRNEQGPTVKNYMRNCGIMKNMEHTKRLRKRMQKQSPAKLKPVSRTPAFPERKRTKSLCLLGQNHTTSTAGRVS